jgi:thiamine-monophosphate kinase
LSDPRIGLRSAGVPPPDERPGADEFAVLARLRERLTAASFPGLRDALTGETYAGDDAAVLLPPAGRLLIATDLLVEDVHFDLSLGSVADAAWKAVAVNVSDIAAMGGEPRHALVGLAGPPGTDVGAIVEALGAAAALYGIGVVGGDLSAAERLILAVTITGECQPGAEVLRSGAGVGDQVWVTGPLGASAAALEGLQRGASLPPAEAAAYLRPVARVAEGRLAASLGATAMIDVSDGLARDVDHIAVESGVGVSLEAVPVAAGARLDQALGGGEDYELVFCVPAGVGVEVADAFAASGLRKPTRIGVCVSDPAERSLDGSPMPIVGWSHSFG